MRTRRAAAAFATIAQGFGWALGFQLALLAWDWIQKMVGRLSTP